MGGSKVSCSQGASTIEKSEEHHGEAASQSSMTGSRISLICRGAISEIRQLRAPSGTAISAWRKKVTMKEDPTISGQMPKAGRSNVGYHSLPKGSRTDAAVPKMGTPLGTGEGDNGAQDQDRHAGEEGRRCA